ncbi:hypothetical protein FZI19_15875 [Cronobacter muytjensii]|uniref:Uncharacterized protein n=1 Tax=Cronobacter muytjensii TaxID=413501 RepID=A0A2T7AJX8_9ENTR|nr:hypothetical protein FZI19_15875 [Cronobacter muytjensii]PUX08728.1 hypothetical protein AUN14_19665 [Cronobacter muytjensii]
MHLPVLIVNVHPLSLNPPLAGRSSLAEQYMICGCLYGSELKRERNKQSGAFLSCLYGSEQERILPGCLN